MNAVERAKKALGVTTDLAMAKALGVHATVIGGYKRRESVPLEQCIKIAQMTGVDLNWLILGEGTSPNGSNTATEVNADLSISEQMMLAGFRALDEQQQVEAFQLLLNLSKKKNNQESRQFGNVSQYVTGNSNIENQTLIQKNK